MVGRCYDVAEESELPLVVAEFVRLGIAFGRVRQFVVLWSYLVLFVLCRWTSWLCCVSP